MSKKPRVIFCTYSSIYSSRVLEFLLQSTAIEVVGIVNSTRLLKPSFNGIIGSVKFIQTTGWRYSTYLFMITDLLAWLQPVSVLKTVHALARTHQLPLLDTVDINRRSEIGFIKSLTPDVLLSAHFNQLFKEPVLQLPTLAAINIHPSLLPAYKGVDPVFYALLRKEKYLGVTAHLMDSTFDTGEILKQRVVSSRLTDNVFAHNMQLFRAGAEIAVKSIQSMLKEGSEGGNNIGSTQQGQGNYDSWPDKKRVKQLRNQHDHLISLSDFFKVIRGA